MMSPEYKVTLGDESYEVSIEKLDEGGLLIAKVNGESFTIKPTLNEDGSWTVNDTSSDYDIKIIKKTGTKVSLELNEETRTLLWERVRKDEDIADSAATSGGARVSGGVYPPMPGKITDVKVSVGDSVESGQTVCILEAMKMFNELKATSSGTVKEINVEQGSSVTPDSLLLLIE